MIWTQFAGVVAFFLSIGLTLVCVLAFKTLHHRAARRAPLSRKQVNHLPGQQLLQRVSDHHDELLVSALLMFMALPLFFAAWAGGHIRWDVVRFDFGAVVFLLAALGLFAFALHRYIKHYRLREKAHDGLVAERVTGVQLNRLAAQGCIVMHDLPAENFNIDHVVIAPRAVYAVETKSFRKPKQGSETSSQVAFDGTTLRFPDFIEKDALAQAQRQAQWLSKLLRETVKRDIPVMPALALPGWYIKTADDVWQTAAVKVFTPMGGGANFMARGTEAIDEVTRNLVRDALAVRYPEIPD